MATGSPERPEFPFDGDEEPLFADDLDFEDDDFGALPPPMPTLAELSARQDRGTNLEQRAGGGQTSIPGFDFGDSGTSQQPGAPAPGDQGPPMKKRKPILTLKIDRIFSEKGLNYIYTEFPKLKFKGKGHEASDLKHLMRHYEHWANMLYPKMTFSDVTDRIETLAKRREFKTRLIRMRQRQARGGAATPPLSDNEEGGDQPAVPPTNAMSDGSPPDIDEQPHTNTPSQPPPSTPTHSHSPTSPHSPSQPSPSTPSQSSPSTSSQPSPSTPSQPSPSTPSQPPPSTDPTNANAQSPTVGEEDFEENGIDNWEL